VFLELAKLQFCYVTPWKVKPKITDVFHVHKGYNLVDYSDIFIQERVNHD
jgi:hypothetical protein